jgi:hypothetical protein
MLMILRKPAGVWLFDLMDVWLKMWDRPDAGWKVASMPAVSHLLRRSLRTGRRAPSPVTLAGA